MSHLYIVDGFNFLHAVVLKGRDRARWWSVGNQAKVVEAVRGLRIDGRPLEVWVVFDRSGTPDSGADGVTDVAPRGAVQVHHAPDADDYIVQRCSELAGRRPVVVVSADRSLRDRAKNYGALSLSPWALAGYARSEPGPSDRGSSATSMSDDTDEERFVRIEVKAAYLEKLAMDLNEVVIEQGRLIDELVRRLELLERQMRAGADDERVPDEKPPHY